MKAIIADKVKKFEDDCIEFQSGIKVYTNFIKAELEDDYIEVYCELFQVKLDEHHYVSVLQAKRISEYKIQKNMAKIEGKMWRNPDYFRGDKPFVTMLVETDYGFIRAIALGEKANDIMDEGSCFQGNGVVIKGKVVCRDITVEDREVQAIEVITRWVKPEDPFKEVS